MREKLNSRWVMFPFPVNKKIKDAIQRKILRLIATNFMTQYDCICAIVYRHYSLAVLTQDALIWSLVALKRHGAPGEPIAKPGLIGLVYFFKTY